MLGRGRISIPVIVTGIVFSMLPDADIIGFQFGIEYGDSWGHRGATHSLTFAAVIAMLTTAILRPDRYMIAGLYLFLAMASHGLLDMLTNGGLGAALFWPISDARIFAPITPIAVSPIGVADFISARGLTVLYSEITWIWTPLLFLVGTVYLVSRGSAKWRQQSGTEK